MPRAQPSQDELVAAGRDLVKRFPPWPSTIFLMDDRASTKEAASKISESWKSASKGPPRRLGDQELAQLTEMITYFRERPSPHIAGVLSIVPEEWSYLECRQPDGSWKRVDIAPPYVPPDRVTR